MGWWFMYEGNPGLERADSGGMTRTTVALVMGRPTGSVEARGLRWLQRPTNVCTERGSSVCGGTVAALVRKIFIARICGETGDRACWCQRLGLGKQFSNRSIDCDRGARDASWGHLSLIWNK
jgi:hypothetical protein